MRRHITDPGRPDEPFRLPKTTRVPVYIEKCDSRVVDDLERSGWRLLRASNDGHSAMYMISEIDVEQIYRQQKT
jgi:hypothetical protein